MNYPDAVDMNEDFEAFLMTLPKTVTGNVDTARKSNAISYTEIAFQAGYVTAIKRIRAENDQ